MRTSHHWDQIGLLRPSGRTGAGHREYTEQDVVRTIRLAADSTTGSPSSPMPAPTWTKRCTAS
ncbi:hypothetical protein MXD58_003175 [Frankia sp. AgKG'84/4]|nr:hypothetical protein [Frankia sp. AgKG'84/4]